MYLKGIAMASHPPIIIPEVGNGREQKAEKTIRGMKTGYEGLRPGSG
ncbi:hypothetical protein [Eubacterium aggregans]